MMNFNIFKYHDGVGERFGDPMDIDHKLRIGCGGNMRQVIDLCKSQNELQRAENLQILLTAATKAFGLHPFDPETGQGCPFEYVLELLNGYWDWSAEQKKSTASTPKSTEPSVSASQ